MSRYHFWKSTFIKQIEKVKVAKSLKIPHILIDDPNDNRLLLKHRLFEQTYKNAAFFRNTKFISDMI